MKTKLKPVALPNSHLEYLHNMNLTVVSYLNDSCKVCCHDGSERNEWLPRDIVAADGKSLLVHRAIGDTHNAYSIAGWDCWHDGMFGGMYASIHSALAWIETARDIRAGKRNTF